MNEMAHPNVRGVVILARNGDRIEYYQDPKSYKPGTTKTTPLGAAQSFNLGSYLRSVYLSPSSPSHIQNLKEDLIDTKSVHVRAKAGGEGTVIFDSAIALLQGLFPPTEKNRITLANETTIVSPLGGYQYIPVETVEPENDRSLEPWTDCPAFQAHIAKVIDSSEYKKVAQDSNGFFKAVKEYVFGTPATFDNIWNVHEYVSSELTHNRTYAYRLPPTFIEQTRGFVDFHQDLIFSSPDIGGIGNIAGRTILSSILGSLERIAYNGDPLQLFIQDVTYQPFISLFHIAELIADDPDIKGLPNFASALAIELRAGDENDSRSWLRFKFKNGTADGEFRTLHAFGHKGDIPLTEFIYRTENYQINSNKQWASVCHSGAVDGARAASASVQFAAGGLLALVLLFGLFVLARFRSQRKGYVRIEGPETQNLAAPQTAAMRQEKARLV